MKSPRTLLSLIAASWLLLLLPQVTSGAKFERSESKHGRSPFQIGKTFTQRLKELVLELKPLEPSSTNLSQKYKEYYIVNLKEKKIKLSKRKKHSNNKKNLKIIESSPSEVKKVSKECSSSDEKSGSKENSTGRKKSESRETSDSRKNSDSRDNSDSRENSDSSSSKDSSNSKESSSGKENSSDKENSSSKESTDSRESYSTKESSDSKENSSSRETSNSNESAGSKEISGSNESSGSNKRPNSEESSNNNDNLTSKESSDSKGNSSSKENSNSKESTSSKEISGSNESSSSNKSTNSEESSNSNENSTSKESSDSKGNSGSKENSNSNESSRSKENSWSKENSSSKETSNSNESSRSKENSESKENSKSKESCSKENSSTKEVSNSNEDSISSKESGSSEENNYSSESNKTTKIPILSTSSTVSNEITTQQTIKTTTEECFTSSVELQNLMNELNFNLSITQQQIHNVTQALIECSKDSNKIQETINLVENLNGLAHEMHFIIQQLEDIKSSRPRKFLISIAKVKNSFNIRNEICGENHNSLENTFYKLAKALKNCRINPVMNSVKRHLYCTSQHFIESIKHVVNNSRSFSKAEEVKYQEIIIKKLLPNIELTRQRIKKVSIVNKMLSKSLKQQLDVLMVTMVETNTVLNNTATKLRNRANLC